MNLQEHLALQLARLRTPDELDQKGEGLIFIFCKGGAGNFTSSMASHRISTGDVLVFNQSIGGRIGVDDNKPEFLFWTFSVCFEHLLPLFSSNEVSLLHNITESFKASKLYPASHPLSVECHRLLGVVPPQFNLDHRGQLIRIAASVLSAEFKEAQNQRTGFVKAEDHMVQVFEKLSASELINLSVSELADRFNCSRRHLNRLFHQHFGVSVASLRMEMRLLKAVSLLRDADAKIINVAEQCGFNHLGLFNTCFKRRFGMSPGQWRKSSLKVESVPARKAPNRLEDARNNKVICPLHESGACPLSNQQSVSAAVSGREIMASVAGKIQDGAEVMEDLKRRELLSGAPAETSGKRHAPGTRANS